MMEKSFNFIFKFFIFSVSSLVMGCVGSISVNLKSLTNSATPEAQFTTTLASVDSSNANNYEVSGKCKASQTFTLKAESASDNSLHTISTMSCSTDGQFSSTKDLSTVPDGNITLTLREVTTDSILDQRVIEKDTVPPTAALLTPPPAVNALNAIISAVSPTDTVSYTFKFSNTLGVDCNIDSGYSASISVATQLNENIAMMSDGVISLCLRGQDAVGNKQTTATIYTWTKNTTIPTALLSGLPSANTNTATSTITVSGTDVQTYRYKFGPFTTTNCSASGGYSVETPVGTSANLNATSGDGPYQLCVVGKNSLGTWQPFTSATSSSWNYDTTLPIVTITSPTAGGYVGSTNQASFPVTITCSENSRIVTVSAVSDVDSSTTSNTGTCTAGSVTINLNLSSFPEGGLKISAAQTDLAGNTGTHNNIAITKDTVAPVLGGTLTDGTYSSSITTSSNLSWSAATDVGGSGIARYQLAIGTTSGGTQALNWTNIGLVTSYQASGLTLSNGVTYYPQIRAVDNGGQVSSAIIGDGFIVDSVAPDVTSVNVSLSSRDLWSNSSSPTISWNTATDVTSSVSEYQVSIGSAAGLSDVKVWTSVGTSTSTTISALTLTRGTTYYANVRALDGAGNASTSKSASWSVNSPLWITDGTVNKVIKSGTTLYISGAFDNVGPWSGGGVPVNSTTGDLAWPNENNQANVTGTVRAVVPDGSGGFYIGGMFTKVGSLARANLAHILADGTVDPTFNPGTDADVQALYRSGTTLYVGGLFTTIGGVNRSYVAALNTTDGSVLTAFNATADGQVAAFALNGSSLYVGGSFTNIGGAARNRIAVVDATTGVAGSFNPNSNNAIQKMILSGTTLFVGGNFSNIGGSARSYLAALDTSTGLALPGFAPNPNGVIEALEISGTTLYVGGYFTTIASTGQKYLAALNTADGTLVNTFTPVINNSVYSVFLSGSTLYISGSITTVSGTNVKNAAAISTTDGTLLTAFNPRPSSPIFAMSMSGSNLYLGGNFSSVGGTQRKNLAAISLIDGKPLPGFNPSPDNVVYRMALSGDTLYVGGDFNNIGGVAQARLAAVNTTTGAVIGSFNPTINSVVNSLLISGSTLYVGGTFSNVNGSGKNYLVSFDTTTGALNTGFSPNPDNIVHTIEASGSNLYIGGEFTQVAGVPRNMAAAISATDGSLIVGFNPNPDGIVGIMKVNGSILYMGGSFSNVDGTPHGRLAAIDLNTHSVIHSFAPSFSFSFFDMLTSVAAIEVSGTTLYLGGIFDRVNGNVTTGLAAIASDGSYISGFKPTGTIWAYSLTAWTDALYYGGVGGYTDLKGTNLAPMRLDTGDLLPNN